jgi:hypothetical protein
MEALADLIGYGDESLAHRYHLDSVDLIQVDLYNAPIQLDLAQIQGSLAQVLAEIWS